MTDSPVGDVTQLLQDWRDPLSQERLFQLVYPELRRIASKQMSCERNDHTLQPTALVHEVYLTLAKSERIAWQGRTHFLGVAARAMRRFLLDYARARGSQKRGRPMDLLVADPDAIASESDLGSVLELDDLLTRFASLDSRAAQVVELRVFGGLTFDECAEVLAVNPKTVKRDWRAARAWFASALSQEGSLAHSGTVAEG